VGSCFIQMITRKIHSHNGRGYIIRCQLKIEEKNT
jgi:hypothetical protein